MHGNPATSPRATLLVAFVVVIVCFVQIASNSCLGQPEEPQAEPAIRPDYSKSTLLVRGKTLPLVQVRERWPVEHLVGDSLVRIKG